MSQETPIWRIALDDKEHPLNSLAWFLFSERMNTKYVAKRFTDQKEQAIPLCYAVVDDETLRNQTALGGGFAPIHSVQLLASWQVKEALPRLFDIIENDDSEVMTGYFFTFLYEETTASLAEFDADIYDEVIEFAEKHQKYSNRVTFVETLRKLKPDDERTYNFICSVLEEITDEVPEHIFDVSENLLKCNFEQGKTHLREFVKRQKDKDIRRYYTKVVEEIIADAEEYTDDQSTE